MFYFSWYLLYIAFTILLMPLFFCCQFPVHLIKKFGHCNIFSIPGKWKKFKSFDTYQGNTKILYLLCFWLQQIFFALNVDKYMCTPHQIILIQIGCISKVTHSSKYCQNWQHKCIITHNQITNWLTRSIE